MLKGHEKLIRKTNEDRFRRFDDTLPRAIIIKKMKKIYISKKTKPKTIVYRSKPVNHPVTCRSSSSICRHLQQDHYNSPRSLDLAKNFAVLRKCQGKMDCLVYEMLLIKKYRPILNIQSDPRRAKVFT